VALGGRWMISIAASAGCASPPGTLIGALMLFSCQ
jgi:hypothetical protein